MQDRAKEASVKGNMHTIQLAFEDFAVQSDGVYPNLATSETPGGDTVQELCPDDAYPDNPFTNAATVMIWDGPPILQGAIGADPANTTDYVIKGFGKAAALELELTTGM